VLKDDAYFGSKVTDTASLRQRTRGQSLRILLIPTTDWIGHPIPSRLHHIFEKIAERNEVHVLRFAFQPNTRLGTRTIVHEIDDVKTNELALYYVLNAYKHLKAIREIVRRNEIDTVVISNLLAGYVAAKAVNGQANTVFDLSDHFPSSGAGYYFDLNSVPGKFTIFMLERLLQSTLRLVKCTVTSSYSLQNYVKKLGVNNAFLVSNGVEEVFLSNEKDGNKIRERWGLDGCVTVGYVGSIEFWLDMSPLLHAIRRLKKRYRVKLFLVGSKLKTRTAIEIQKEIRSLGIEKNVVWTNQFVPHVEMPEYIAAMDICTIPFKHDHPTAYYSDPIKLWEYLALEKPVITTPIPDPIAQAGEYINVATKTADYVRIIENFVKDPDIFKVKAGKARELVKRRTWSKIAERYEQVLRY